MMMIIIMFLRVIMIVACLHFAQKLRTEEITNKLNAFQVVNIHIFIYHQEPSYLLYGAELKTLPLPLHFLIRAIQNFKAFKSVTYSGRHIQNLYVLPKRRVGVSYVVFRTYNDLFFCINLLVLELRNYVFTA